MAFTEEETLSPLYAVIDLGSNSFHMLITRQLADSVQVVDKVKRKVRLASGLDSDNVLSESVMAKGLKCLSFFAERLQDIPTKNIRVVATATLRLAKNRADFIVQAEQILAHKITLLSGIEEAENIYLGVAHTSCSADKRLILDIGGASTEIIAGHGFEVKKAISLNIGCVTFNQKYFANGTLSKDNFCHAIAAAEKIIAPISEEYCHIGWQCVLGGSGTMQALAEILIYQHKPSTLTLDYLYQIQNQLLNFDNIEEINIPGLTPERSPVIASGLAILIALFQQLSIKSLALSSGALREGLLYEMLANSRQTNIRQRTVNALSQRFHIDKDQASRVKQQVIKLFSHLAPFWQLSEDNAFEILLASCDLHEIGLLLSYKSHQQHSGYILAHADLAGFSYPDRQLLLMFVTLYKGEIDSDLLVQQSATKAVKAKKLLILLRLAVILCRRRADVTLPDYHINVCQQTIQLSLPKNWLAQHPLIADELMQENQYLSSVDFSLTINN